MADEKCYILGTGGGPLKKPPELTDIDIEIKEILGDRIDGLSSEFGGDGEIITIINETANRGNSKVFHNIPSTSQVESKDVADYEIVEENSAINELETAVPNLMTPDWTMNTVEILRMPKSKAIAPGDRSNKRKRKEYDALCCKVSHWAGSKANLEAEKIKYIEKEHNFKINLMEEKCRTEIELMRKESDAKIQRIEKEMEVTLQGISEQNILKKEILLLQKHEIIQQLQKKC